jgi:hypothetical protein
MLTPAQVAVLASELASDPLGRGYAGMINSPALIAESLNALDRTGYITVDAAAVRQASMMSFAYPAIEDLCTDTNATKEQRYAARIFVKTVEAGSFQAFHMDDPAIRTAVATQLALILASGAITQEQHDAILATGTGSISRAAELGLPQLDWRDVVPAIG